MRRVSGTDTMFFSLETRSWHQHVGVLMVLDTSDAPEFGYDRLVALVESRIGYAPKFRWKLKEVPLNLDRPVWVDDRSFDVRRHVRRVGVPSPGGDEQVANLAGEIMSFQLDRRRPLWEAWLFEELEGQRAAVLLKYHNALLDGPGGASLGSVLTDLVADTAAATASLTRPTARRAGAEPSDLTLLAQSLLPTMRTPQRVARVTRRLLDDGWRTATALLGLESNPQHVPRTVFNGPIGARRTLAFTSIDLERLKATKAKHDVTVNDVILAMCGGAIRRYLGDRNALPEATLVAGVPVSTRAEGERAVDNQLAATIVELATDVDDPAERLAAIHTNMSAVADNEDAVDAQTIQDIGAQAPPLLLNLAIRGAQSSGLVPLMPAIMNTSITNMPGPDAPLYLAGARLDGMYASSLIVEGMGLAFTVFSHEGQVDFSVLADGDQVDDVWEIVEGLEAALAEIEPPKRGRRTKAASTRRRATSS
jgi:WS/DGAT/MGAT family acyltransferase